MSELNLGGKNWATDQNRIIPGCRAGAIVDKPARNVDNMGTAFFVWETRLRACPTSRSNAY